MVQDIKEEQYSPKMNDDHYYRYNQHNYGMNTLGLYTHYDCMNFQVNNIRRVEYEGEIEYQTENIKLETKPAVLCDLDGQNKRNSPCYDYNCAEEPLCKKLIFDHEEEQIIDLDRWRKVPIVRWERNDTKSWLIHASKRLGQPYRELSPNLIMPGNELFFLPRLDFVMYDRRFGGELYDLLHERRTSTSSLPPFGTINRSLIADDQTSIGSDNYSDGESLNDLEPLKKPGPGRPKKLIGSKTKTAKVKLWEFIRDLLLNPQYCPVWICWEDYENKRFRFIESDRVAKLWGDRKNNKKMTYEKFSRAMRYYYPKKIFKAVPGRRLVYEFGSKATGLETKCPNFNRPVSKMLVGSKV